MSKHSLGYRVLDAGEWVQHAIYKSPIGPERGARLLAPFVGANSDAYHQLLWVPRSTIQQVLLRKTVTVEPQPAAPPALRPKQWQTTTILSVSDEELYDMRRLHPQAQEAVGYITEGALRVGTLAVKAAIFHNINPRLGLSAVAVREGDAACEYSLGLYDPAARVYYGAQFVRREYQHVRQADLTADHPGVWLV